MVNRSKYDELGQRIPTSPRKPHKIKESPMDRLADVVEEMETLWELHKAEVNALQFIVHNWHLSIESPETLLAAARDALDNVNSFLPEKFLTAKTHLSQNLTRVRKQRVRMQSLRMLDEDWYEKFAAGDIDPEASRKAYQRSIEAEQAISEHKKARQEGQRSQEPSESPTILSVPPEKAYLPPDVDIEADPNALTPDDIKKGLF